MRFTTEKFQDLSDPKFLNIENLENYKTHLENNVSAAKETIVAFEAEIANCVARLKTLASDAVEVVQEAVEPVVEVVKEEVKKAAPKKPARKAAAKKEEETPEKDVDSDK